MLLLVWGQVVNLYNQIIFPSGKEKKRLRSPFLQHESWVPQCPYLSAVQGADVDHIDAEQQVQRPRLDSTPLLPLPGHVQVQRGLHIGQPLGLGGGGNAVVGSAWARVG